jgi:hypothetical protein
MERSDCRVVMPIRGASPSCSRLSLKANRCLQESNVPLFSLATRCQPLKPRPRVQSITVAASLVILLGAGCATKHAAASVPVAPERRVTLDARSTGRVGPADIYPDLSITPRVAASDVTQDNIKTTICVSGFTAPPRRPPSSYRQTQGAGT